MRYIVVHQPPVAAGRANVMGGEELASARTLNGAIAELRHQWASSTQPFSLRVLRERDGVRESCTVPEIERVAEARASF